MISLRFIPKPLKQAVILVISLLALSAHTYAETDPRMIVQITADKQGKMPSVKDAVQLALPILWDRVVADSDRASLSGKVRGTSFLLRVVPHREDMEVVFNQERVWQYLDQQGITYFKDPVRMSLQIQMVNQKGAGMPKTATELLSHAKQIALARGIMLEPDAPELKLNWRWLDASQLSLSIEGNTALETLFETRVIKRGNQIEQLKAWVEEVLLNIREVQIAKANVNADMPVKEIQDGRIRLNLTVEQSASLPEQVILEEALRRDSRVKSMIPTFLSESSRQYRLVLNGTDDSWLADWFRRRGMRISPTLNGWLVH